MKVVHVIPSVSEAHGGPSQAIRAFAKAAEGKGVSATVATTDDDGDHARLAVSLNALVERDGITHIFFRRDFLHYKISFGLARWLRQNVKQFDLVHIHALFSFSSFAAARAARKYGVPYIIRPLGVLNKWGLQNRRPLLKRAWLKMIELPSLRGAAAIHYTTQAEASEAAKVHPDITKVPSFVIPVPVAEYASGADQREFARKFPQAAGKRVILFLSRLDRKKGLELLLNSFAGICASDPDLLLVIAGDGAASYVDLLRRLANELHISGKILWTGHLGPGDKAAVFAAASIFVLPSYSENFGIAAAEAMLAGLPCVLSDQVALTENLCNGESAMIVPCDLASVGYAIRQLLDKPELRSRIAGGGRDVAIRHFSSEAVGEMLLRCYRSLVAVRD